MCKKIYLIMLLVLLSNILQSCKDCDCPTAPEDTPTPLPTTVPPTLTPTAAPTITGTPLPTLTPTPTLTPIPDLSIEPAYAVVPVSASCVFTAHGGISPYNWYLNDNTYGTLQASGSQVVFTSGTKTGSVHLYVVDSGGRDASALIVVGGAN